MIAAEFSKRQEYKGGIIVNLYEAVDQLFNLVWLLLMVRILLSWFPNVDWWKQPFKFLHDATEPILDPFRRIIPPIGGLDISPIVAFLFINILQNVVLGLIYSFS